MNNSLLSLMALLVMLMSAVGVGMNFFHVWKHRGRAENCYIVFKSLVLCYFFIVYGLILFNVYGFGEPEMAPPYIRPAIMVLVTLAACDAWLRNVKARQFK